MDFSRNDNASRWECDATLFDRPVTLHLDYGYTEAELDEVGAEALARVQQQWARIQNNIADSLLETYNDEWSDPDDAKLPELSRQDFLKRIELHTIDVMEERALSLYFSDSDLFGGHIVDVFWTEDDVMHDATLLG